MRPKFRENLREATIKLKLDGYKKSLIDMEMCLVSRFLSSIA